MNLLEDQWEAHNYSIYEIRTPTSSAIVDLVERIAKQIEISPSTITGKLELFLNNLKLPVFVVVEGEYVDRFFRSLYYNYYSTKFESVSRNCVRLSFFSEVIAHTDFIDEKKHERLQNCYLGFTTIRPLRKCLGRTVLSPRALSQQGLRCEVSESPTSVLGVKLVAKGFPHTDQDGEYLTCAETAVWGVLEYFGSKYAEYRLVRPEEIKQASEQFAVERKIPSAGLTIFEISQILNQFNITSVIYSKRREANDCHAFEAKEFHQLLHFYIESGIPVIAGLVRGENGHAVVNIGHTEASSQYSPKKMANGNKKLDRTKVETIDGVHLICSSQYCDQYLLSDDNHPPYKKVDLETFKGEVTDFVVPLYKKIYLDASRAFSVARSTFVNKEWGIHKYSPGKENKPYVYRFFLTSARSYKHFRVTRPIGGSTELSTHIATSNLPKFLYIFEFSTPPLYKDKQILGHIAVDATGGDKDTSAIIFAHYPGFFGTVEGGRLEFVEAKEANQPYELYENNLALFPE